MERFFKKMPYYFRIAFVGEGKTRFLERYVQGHFMECYDPGPNDPLRKIVEIDGKEVVVLELMDTCGQEEYRIFTYQCIIRAHGIVLGYSIAYRRTFEDLKTWMQLIKDYKTETPVMLIGNQCDLEERREVSYEEGLKYAQENGIKLFFESK